MSLTPTTHFREEPSGVSIRESLGMVDPWWRGIPGEIWVVSETRIHGEIEGKFPR